MQEQEMRKGGNEEMRAAFSNPSDPGFYCHSLPAWPTSWL